MSLLGTVIVPRGRAATPPRRSVRRHQPAADQLSVVRTGRAVPAAAGRRDELSAGGRDLVHGTAAAIRRRTTIRSPPRSPTRPRRSRRAPAGADDETRPLRRPPRLCRVRRAEGSSAPLIIGIVVALLVARRRGRMVVHARLGAPPASATPRPRAAAVAAPPGAGSAGRACVGRGRTGRIRAPKWPATPPPSRRPSPVETAPAAPRAASGRAVRAFGLGRRGASASPRRSGASARRATRPSARPRPRRSPSSSNSRPPPRSGPSRRRRAARAEEAQRAAADRRGAAARRRRRRCRRAACARSAPAAARSPRRSASRASAACPSTRTSRSASQLQAKRKSGVATSRTSTAVREPTPAQRAAESREELPCRRFRQTPRPAPSGISGQRVLEPVPGASTGCATGAPSSR